MVNYSLVACLSSFHLLMTFNWRYYNSVKQHQQVEETPTYHQRRTSPCHIRAFLMTCYRSSMLQVICGNSLAMTSMLMPWPPPRSPPPRSIGEISPCKDAMSRFQHNIHHRLLSAMQTWFMSSLYDASILVKLHENCVPSQKACWQWDL
jgi:hypothetical protein